MATSASESADSIAVTTLAAADAVSAAGTASVWATIAASASEPATRSLTLVSLACRPAAGVLMPAPVPTVTDTDAPAAWRHVLRWERLAVLAAKSSLRRPLA